MQFTSQISETCFRHVARADAVGQRDGQLGKGYWWRGY
jgi:hypothetical protein